MLKREVATVGVEHPWLLQASALAWMKSAVVRKKGLVIKVDMETVQMY